MSEPSLLSALRDLLTTCHYRNIAPVEMTILVKGIEVVAGGIVAMG